MNNKDAIDRLNGMQSRCENGYDAEAIFLAIDALENTDKLGVDLVQAMELVHKNKQPVGKWIKNYKDYNCSNCGKIAYSWNCHGTYIPVESEYCPHCGAKMLSTLDAEYLELLNQYKKGEEK